MKQFIFESNIELRETQTAAFSDTRRQANWEEMASHLSLWDLKRIKQFGFGKRIKPDKQFVLDAFEQHVQQAPESIAIIDGEKRLSYRELNLRATQLAEELVYVGVRQGDYIGLFVSRSESLIVAIIASLKIGAIYIPQDAKKTPANALKSIVELVKPAAILTTETCCGLLPDFNQTNTFTIENLLQRNTAFNQQATVSVSPTKDSDDTCFVLFTSGTTGTPNGVCVSHKNLSNIIMTQPGDLGIKPGMVVSQLLSISFDMSAWEIFGALCHGATLILRGSDFQATASRANVIIATPSILARINPSLCPELETVAVAGEPCPISLAEKWSGFCQFYNCCGPTETTIVNTMQKYHRGKPLSIGKPTPNNIVYVLNDDMQPCAIGEVGEMWAGGACVTKGYLGNDALTAERYVPDPFLADGSMMFRTRDLGRWTSNGELEHIGRTDDQVKVRGFRVELDGVSRQLETKDDIELAVTLKLDDRTLISFITPEICTEQEGKAHLKHRLPYYSIPEHIVALDKLPLTPRGKIDKRKLMDMFLRDQQASVSNSQNEGAA